MTEAISQRFPAWPSSVAAVRGFVAAALDALPPTVCETASLLVSELATNAVRHGSGAFDVSVRHLPDNRVWVGVTDAGPGHPVLRSPAITDEHGRGLRLVASFAQRWGVRRRQGERAKTVWFELSAVPNG